MGILYNHGATRGEISRDAEHRLLMRGSMYSTSRNAGSRVRCDLRLLSAENMTAYNCGTFCYSLYSSESSVATE